MVGGQKHVDLVEMNGHKEGIKNAGKIIIESNNLGLKYITFYVFSSENWYRSVEEVTGLMKLFEYYIASKSEELIKKNIKVNFIGNLSKVPRKLLKCIDKLVKKSSNNSGMNLLVALSYGGREEIVHAAKKIAIEYKQENCLLDEINEDFFRTFLYKDNVPYPDLLIRTGGDFRISNFLLWQIAYTELYFTQTYWPDFSVEELRKAIFSFQKRERRYGR